MTAKLVKIWFYLHAFAAYTMMCELKRVILIVNVKSNKGEVIIADWMRKKNEQNDETKIFKIFKKRTESIQIADAKRAHIYFTVLHLLVTLGNCWSFYVNMGP